MKTLLKLLILVASVGTGGQALAIGTTLCSNAEGTIKRIEREIWGANPISWSIHGVEVDRQDVVVERHSTKLLHREITFDSPLGEKKIESFVMKISFPVGGESERDSDFVICRTVEYPNAID